MDSAGKSLIRNLREAFQAREQVVKQLTVGFCHDGRWKGYDFIVAD
jgi:hypothetical protein